MRKYATPAGLSHRCPRTSCPFFLLDTWNAQQWIKFQVSVTLGTTLKNLRSFEILTKETWLIIGVRKIQRRVVALSSVSFIRDLPRGVTFCPILFELSHKHSVLL